MKPTDRQESPENRQTVEKKKYRKPIVQVYGSLAEGTKAASNPPTRHADGSHGPGWTTLRT